MDRICFGKKGEELAANFLRKSGYDILETNYRSRLGEIDIIAEQDGTLVFVEVKARSSLKYGDPKAALTEHKKRQISKTALEFISKKRLSGCKARFDVVAIQFKGGKPYFELVRNAFDLAY